MEALALLCTLHADGPTSLRRLRSAGCASLVQLERMPIDELAGVLEVPPAVARRLAREARGLSSRLDLGLDDSEEAPELGQVQAAPPTQALSGATGGGSGHSTGRGSSLGRRERALLERVVGHWRESDRETPPLVVDRSDPQVASEASGAGPDQPRERELAPREADPILAETVEARPTTEAQAAEDAPLHPEARAAKTPAALVGGEVDGLDAGLAEALAAVGITDLASLARADALSLSRKLERPFATLRRVQFLAARRAAEAAAPEAAPAGDPAQASIPEPLEERPIAIEPGGAEMETAPKAAPPIQPARRPDPSDRPEECAAASAPEARPLVPANQLPLPVGERPKLARKFWDPLPRWAEHLDVNALEEPTPLPPEAPTPPASPRQPSRRRGRTLGWSFEVPRPTPPAPTSLSGSVLDTPSAAPVPLEPPREEEGTAGPFA